MTESVHMKCARCGESFSAARIGEIDERLDETLVWCGNCATVNLVIDNDFGHPFAADARAFYLAEVMAAGSCAVVMCPDCQQTVLYLRFGSLDTLVVFAHIAVNHPDTLPAAQRLDVLSKAEDRWRNVEGGTVAVLDRNQALARLVRGAGGGLHINLDQPGGA